MLASGTVRSNKGLTHWLQDNAKGIHTKYASTLLYTATFTLRNMTCTAKPCPAVSEFLHDRIGRANPNEVVDIAASIAFAVGMATFNMFLYLLPLPICIRRKFRD